MKHTAFTTATKEFNPTPEQTFKGDMFQALDRAYAYAERWERLSGQPYRIVHGDIDERQELAVVYAVPLDMAIRAETLGYSTNI